MQSPMVFGVGLALQPTDPPTVQAVVPGLSAERALMIVPGDQLLLVGGESALDLRRACELIQGAIGTVVKLTFRRPNSTNEYECVLMRGPSEYLDLFDECQRQKKTIALHHDAIEENSKLTTKIKELEAELTKAQSQIKALETTEAAKSRAADDLARKTAINSMAKDLEGVDATLQKATADLERSIALLDIKTKERGVRMEAYCTELKQRGGRQEEELKGLRAKAKEDEKAARAAAEASAKDAIAKAEAAQAAATAEAEIQQLKEEISTLRTSVIPALKKAADSGRAGCWPCWGGGAAKKAS